MKIDRKLDREKFKSDILERFKKDKELESFHFVNFYDSGYKRALIISDKTLSADAVFLNECDAKGIVLKETDIYDICLIQTADDTIDYKTLIKIFNTADECFANQGIELKEI